MAQNRTESGIAGHEPSEREQEREKEKERARRAAYGTKLYLVFMEPVEGAGDRSVAREAHFAFVKGLEAQGHLFAGGPIIDDETGRTTGHGLFIMRGGSVAEIERLVAGDPFVTGGFRRPTIKPWRLAEGRLDLSLVISQRSWSL